MSIALFVGVTRAGVITLDPSHCVDPDRLENETRLLLGDRMTDGLEIVVTVLEEEPGVRTVTTVEDSGSQVWTRELAATRPDCPALPEALALSLHQGLAAIPGWSFDPPAPRRPSWTTGLRAALGTQRDLRFGLAVGLGYPVLPRLEAWAEVQGGASTPIAVGDGTATTVTAALALGLDQRLPLGESTLAIGVGGVGGPLWATGKGFDRNKTAVAPRAAVLARVTLQPPGPLRFGLTLEVPVLQVELVERDGGRLRESPLRVGLTLGLHIP